MGWSCCYFNLSSIWQWMNVMMSLDNCSHTNIREKNSLLKKQELWRRRNKDEQIYPCRSFLKAFFLSWRELHTGNYILLFFFLFRSWKMLLPNMVQIFADASCDASNNQNHIQPIKYYCFMFNNSKVTYAIQAKGTNEFNINTESKFCVLPVILFQICSKLYCFYFHWNWI